MITFCNSYVLWLLRCVQLRLVTVTFFDVNVVWCHVLSQYLQNSFSYYIWAMDTNIYSWFRRKERDLLAGYVLRTLFSGSEGPELKYIWGRRLVSGVGWPHRMLTARPLSQCASKTAILQLNKKTPSALLTRVPTGCWLPLSSAKGR